MVKETYVAEERLYLTKEGDKVVRRGAKTADRLFATPGTEIPMAEAERLGLVKAAEPAADKSRKPAEDKGR